LSHINFIPTITLLFLVLLLLQGVVFIEFRRPIAVKERCETRGYNIFERNHKYF